MKYFFIAGEPSGDQHAGRLMKALAAGDPGAQFSFLGGDRMAETAGKPVVHINRMAFMGFTQVLGNLGKVLRNFSIAKKAVLSFNPDVVILVDYPGFNLRMARWLKLKGFKVYYYIVPAVWAWNARRVYRLKAWCDKIFPILPFEPEFFRNCIQRESFNLAFIFLFSKSFNRFHRRAHMAFVGKRYFPVAVPHSSFKQFNMSALYFLIKRKVLFYQRNIISIGLYSYNLSCFSRIFRK